MKEGSSTMHVLKTAQNFKYMLIVEGLATGLVAGLVAVFYRMLLGFAEDAIGWLSLALKEHFWYLAGWFVILIVMGFLVAKLLTWEPLISGSGIPQVEGEILSFLDQRWYRVLVAKIVGGTLCAFGGLSLGREGPSIQLGAMCGKAIAKIFHRVKMEERLLLTCGAAAGLSAAFNAPLAGVMFALEEIHKNFNVHVLICVMCASITGDFISSNIFGLAPALSFVVKETLPLQYYGLILLLGILCGVAGKTYNTCTMNVQRLFSNTKLKQYVVIVPFLVAGVSIVWMPELLGGGHRMMEVLEGPLVIRTLLLLLVMKFAFSLISFGSGAPGGIFFPLLVLGSFVGAIFAQLSISWFHIPAYFASNFIIMAMAGAFAGIVRAPITGIILIAEMSGTLTHLLPLAVVSLASYLTASLLHSEPIYESLLHKLLWKHGVDLSAFSQEKHLVQCVVELGSHACDLPLAQVDLPQKCLIISILRGEKELIPNGETIIKTGDTLVALLNDEDAPYIQHELERCCTHGL